MSNNPIFDTKALCEAHGLVFTDCGNGHIQIKGCGRMVNYWPLSKKQTAYRDDGRKETNCRPYDAVRLCMGKDVSLASKQQPAKNRPQIDLEPIVTNPAGLKHFYSGDLPPWEESLGNFELYYTDSIRMAAYRLEQDAMEMRIAADEIDQQPD